MAELKTTSEIFCAVELGIISPSKAAELLNVKEGWLARLSRRRRRIAGKSPARFWLLDRGGALRTPEERAAIRGRWWGWTLPERPAPQTAPRNIPF